MTNLAAPLVSTFSGIVTLLLGVSGILVFIPQESQAKTFKNSYVSFELPDSWNCKLEHTDWVCRSEMEKQSKEAIIILTAKEVGPTDSLEQYISHLSRPQQVAYKGATGSGTSNIVYQPKRSMINNHTWVDGLHMGSEVINYFTRYMATIKDRIAVLVTLSAHKDFYTQYSQQFFKTVDSLRVIATSSLSGNDIRPQGSQGVFGANPLPQLVDNATEGSEVAAPQASSGGGVSSLSLLFFGLAILLAAVGAYVYKRSKK